MNEKDLSKPNLDKMQEVDLSAIIDKEAKEKPREVGQFITDAFTGMDKMIEETKEESLNFVKSAKEKAFDEDEEDLDSKDNLKFNDKKATPYINMDKEAMDLLKELESKTAQVEEPKKEEKPLIDKFKKPENKENIDTSKSPELQKQIDEQSKHKSIFDVDDEDFEDDEEEKDNLKEENPQEVQFKELKKTIKEKIKPITNVIDLKSFTVSKSSVSTVDALNTVKQKKLPIDWILPATGVSINMNSFSADEIEELNPRENRQNAFNMLDSIYRSIYKHINFPLGIKITYEQWLSTVNFYDINHLYFAIFKASFNNNNLIPYQCPKCKHVYMIDTPIENMVKYEDDATKQAAMKLLETVNFNPTKYEVERVQASDDLVIDFKEPSIYDVVFTNARLDEKFTNKYFNLLEMISYIDNIFVINRQRQTLDPIRLEEYPENPIKTLKGKIRRYSAMLQTLNSDQRFYIRSYIENIAKSHNKISYILPGAKCPKCKHEIPESQETAESILFIRHRLMDIATSPNV